MGQYSTDFLSWVADPQAEMHPRFWLFWFKMSSNDFTRGKNETQCLTGLTLHFGAKTANLNWRNSESKYTGLTWKRNFFPPSYVEIVSLVCFGTKDYFSRIEFVRFYAHYRKKKRVFLCMSSSIMAHHPPPPPLPPPPPQNFLDPSAHLHWSLFPNDWLSPLGYLGLFYLSDRKDLQVIFLYVNQVVNRKISEFIARKFDFFTFNIPLTIETALRSFENQTMIIKRNGKQTVLQN